MKHSAGPIVAVVQARMGSSRLTGKTAADLGGIPLLSFMLKRVARAQRLDATVVATSSLPRDDTIARLAQEAGVGVFRGSEHDVLKRCVEAAREAGARTVVRLTGNCPLIDPIVIDHVISEFLDRDVDVAANNVPYTARTYPDGMDVEVCSMAALESAHRRAVDPEEREHVTRFLYYNGYRVHEVHLPEDQGAVRITVDLPKDLELVREIVAEFGDQPEFGLREILRWLAGRSS